MNDTAVLTIDEQASEATRFTDELVRAFGLEASVAAEVVDDDIELRVEGSSLGVLVGPKGATLHALEELVRAVVQHAAGGQSARLHLDVAGYRQRRREALAAFVEQVANEVLDSGTEKALEPMNPPDRKVVHDTIAELDGVETTSVGEEPRRRVVIKPAVETPGARRRPAPVVGFVGVDGRRRTPHEYGRRRARRPARTSLGPRRPRPGPRAGAPRPRAAASGSSPRRWSAGFRRERSTSAPAAEFPGLVLAVDWPECHWLFVDASGRRTADLSLAVQELGLVSRVVVRTARAEDLAHEPDLREAADLVTARSFAAPAITAEIADRPGRAGRLGDRQRTSRKRPRPLARGGPRRVRVRPGRGAGRGGRNLRRPPEAGRGAGGAPAPDATPRQTPGLVSPRPGLANATDRRRSTWNVDTNPCTPRNVVVLSRAIVPRGTRASVSAESRVNIRARGPVGGASRIWRHDGSR